MIFCGVDCSNTKLRAFYGKWIEALFTYDVDVLEEYLKASAGSGSGASTSMSRPAKVCNAHQHCFMSILLYQRLE